MTKTLRNSILALLLAAPGLAAAGPFADDMAKCMVTSATPADRSALVKWIFGLMTLHPDLASMSNITQQQRDDINKSAAAIFQKLLTVSCRAQTQQAVLNEGPQALQYAFQILGGTATQGMLSTPQVADGAKDFVKYIDMNQLKLLLSPAPETAPAQSPAPAPQTNGGQPR